MSEPSARVAEMFPVLDPGQIARIRAVGREREIGDGEILFDQGAPAPSFVVVLAGAIEVVHPYAGGEHPIRIHGPGEFTGGVWVWRTGEGGVSAAGQ